MVAVLFSFSPVDVTYLYERFRLKFHCNILSDLVSFRMKDQRRNDYPQISQITQI